MACPHCTSRLSDKIGYCRVCGVIIETDYSADRVSRSSKFLWIATSFAGILASIAVFLYVSGALLSEEPEVSQSPPPAIAEDGRININTADSDVLASVPHFGPAIVQVILARRLARGAYENLDDIDALPQFGPQRMADIREAVTVGDGVTVWVPEGFRRSFRPYNVNTARVEDLVKIPFIKGMKGEQIVHEREKNGPYAGMDDMKKRLYGFGDEKLFAMQDLIVFKD